MPLRFTDHAPIYQQLLAHFETLILNGSLKPGDKLPSVRDLAMEIGVNPNTMQKTLALLEGQRLMYTERTSGRFVTQDTSAIEGLRNTRTRQIIETFFADMEKIGYDREHARTLLLEAGA